MCRMDNCVQMMFSQFVILSQIWLVHLNSQIM